MLWTSRSVENNPPPPYTSLGSIDILMIIDRQRKVVSIKNYTFSGSTGHVWLGHTNLVYFDKYDLFPVGQGSFSI